MTTNNKYYSILVLIAFIAFGISCKKKCDPPEYFHDLSSEGRKMLPYSGFDTLTFVRTSVGDTHVFIGNGKLTQYAFEGIAADCGGRDKYVDYFCTYKSASFNFPLIIGQKTNGGYSSAGETYIDFQRQLFEGQLGYNWAIPDLDSLMVLNKLYTKVDMIPDVKPNISPFTAYFVKELGCIKIVFENGETWELLDFKK